MPCSNIFDGIYIVLTIIQLHFKNIYGHPITPKSSQYRSEPHRTTWNHMEPHRTTQNNEISRKITKNMKKHRKI